MKGEQAVTFANMSAHYIQVVLPLALRGVFTYEVPEELMEEVLPGKRVIVPFGPKRLYAGLVLKLGAYPAKGARIKSIEYVLDDEPIVNEFQLQFWEWLATYYMCGMGEVMLAALPGAMRLSSQTVVVLNQHETSMDQFDALDRAIMANLEEDRAVAIEKLEDLGSRLKVQQSLHRLVELGIVEVREALDEKVKPKTKTMVRIAEALYEHGAMEQALNQLSNAPAQLGLMMKLIDASQFFDGAQHWVDRQKLLNISGASSAILNALKERGFVEFTEALVNAGVAAVAEGRDLSELQQQAVHQIATQWKQQHAVLLHGVTGSGKTLVYAELAKRAMAQGQQVLYLVPEIALTTQLVERMKALVNDDIMVYHSRFSNKQRLTMWMQMLSGDRPKMIIGARSSIFLPFANLGVVIVDEEHESSYKQQEVSPHYNARDAAHWMALKLGAKLLLGSATPSLESYNHARAGKYGLVNMNQRFGEVKMPEIAYSDMRLAMKEKKMKADFTPESLRAIQGALAAGRQVIIFQNRRGFAPYQICQSCGWSGACKHCDVSLTYHKFYDKLLCHYCGYGIPKPTHCPDCGSAKLTIKGSGTEKIEDDLDQLFPDARIVRMDLDTTRKKAALENIITAFEQRSLDILVGTQMVTKGLDFENVALVVVMNADSLWYRPDFRAFEKAFQLLTQVSGRAGRKERRGQVIIQTFDPKHPLLDLVQRNDYRGLYENQMVERQQFNYPPFSRVIKIILSHKDPKRCKKAAHHMASELKPIFGARLLGPEEPPIARIRNRYLRQIYLKIERGLSGNKARAIIWQAVDTLEGNKEFASVRVQIDVDPL